MRKPPSPPSRSCSRPAGRRRAPIARGSPKATPGRTGWTKSPKRMVPMVDPAEASILAPVADAGGDKLKIVTVMTTTADGGAEFAAMEMLWALEQRGHDTLMITDRPSIARDTGVRVEEIDIGPKLSRRDWPRIAASWPVYLRRLRN